ncbi:E3 ubiquitin-protein ligase RNF212B isoform X3 [Ranitomeya variabilis]|uniref:E3 ubiquitin-protein ligase RNF212B isoform X3 n=1 Tax=Ranitomeya variabilis TaxID=490064 RepID=UPI004055DCC3
MDWFHCNVCHMRQETAYYITSCGHILCKTCITQDLCSVCKTACKYLPISDNLKPLEKIYFKSCKESLQKGFHSISQAWRFQKQQHELHVTFYKQCLNKAQDAFQVALLKIETQQSELKTIKKENDELRSMVTQLKSSISRSQSSSRSTTPRPIAITPPSQTVTPQHNFHQYGQMNSHSSSAESPYVRSQSGTGSVRLFLGTAYPLVTGPLHQVTCWILLMKAATFKQLIQHLQEILYIPHVTTLTA